MSRLKQTKIEKINQAKRLEKERKAILNNMLVGQVFNFYTPDKIISTVEKVIGGWIYTTQVELYNSNKGEIPFIWSQPTSVFVPDLHIDTT